MIATSTQTTNLHRAGQVLCVQGNVEEIAARFPQCPERVLSSASRSQLREVRRSFIKVSDQGFALAPVGLEPIVRNICEELKVPVDGDTSPEALPQPISPGAEARVAVDSDVVGLVSRGNGVIYAGNDVDYSIPIAQLAIAYPDIRMAILASSKKQAGWLCQCLRSLLPDEAVSILAGQGIPKEKPRIAIGGPQALLGNCTDLPERDLLIALDAVGALGKLASELFAAHQVLQSHLDNQATRRLGFLPRNAKLSPRDEFHLRCVFGFEEMQIPRQGYRALPVDCLLEEAKLGQLNDQQLTPQSFWRHKGFNKHVSRLAAGVASSNWEQLSGFPRTRRALRRGQSYRVALLAGSLEHAANLLPRLEGWRLVVNGEPNMEGLCNRHLMRKAMRRENESLPTIYTAAAAQELDPSQVDVLIRADAGNDLPPLKANSFQVAQGNWQRLLLIDFDDRRHSQLRQFTESRKQAYRQQGWYSPGADCVEQRRRTSSNGMEADVTHDYHRTGNNVYHRTGNNVATNQPASHYWKRRQARRQQVQAGSRIPRFDSIIDSENLLHAYRELATRGGEAPGADRVTYADLGRREQAQAMRDLHQRLHNGTYQPGVARAIRIAKASGGYRTLRLRSIVDRVVAKVLADALGPYFESIFLPGSHGFRHNRSRMTMLAELARVICEEERFIIAQDDIRQAFDHLRVDTVMGLLRDHVHGKRLFALIRTVLSGDGVTPGTIGIDQGSPLSPLLLNVALHYVLDLPSSEPNAATVPWLRYADNLVYLCQTESEGEGALQAARTRLTPYGMTLKGEDPIVDLQTGNAAELLGMRVRWEDGQIRFSIPEEAWGRLECNLSEPCTWTNPGKAKSLILGWISEYGPAFEGKRTEPVLDRVIGVAAATGQRELSRQELTQSIQAAEKRWLESKGASRA